MTKTTAVLIIVIICLIVIVAALSTFVILEVREASYFAKRWGETSFSNSPWSGILTSRAALDAGKEEKCDRALVCLRAVTSLMTAAKTGKPAVPPIGLDSFMVKSYPGHPSLLCFFEEGGRRWVVYRGTVGYQELIQDDFALDYAKEHYEREASLLLKAGIPTLMAVPQRELKLTDSITAKVHEGFLSLCVLTLADVNAFAASAPSAPLLIGGHSLGAGVAAVCAAVQASQGRNVRAFLCACPRPGDSILAAYLLSSTECSTFMNVEDPIPNSPLSITPDFESGTGVVKNSVPPNIFAFGVQAGTLEDNHSIDSYTLGINTIKGT